MKTQEFLKELKALDNRIEIIENPNRPGLSNVKIYGTDICPLPSEEIKDEPDNSYRYEFPNGMSARHKSRVEVLAQVKAVLEMINTKEGSDEFFNN